VETLSMTVGVIVPVLIPSRRTAAPVGRELTDIFPTADTVNGRNSISESRNSRERIFFIALLPFFPFSFKELTYESDIFCHNEFFQVSSCLSITQINYH
jgi:hypothetical protein